MVPVWLLPFLPYKTAFVPVKAGMDPHHESLFLGVQTECAFTNGCSSQASQHGLPPLNDHIFEWHDLIAAIECSTGQFNMLELGAGWAKWIVDATKITRKLNRTTRAVGVEAQPIHCKMARRHILTNKAAPEASLLCGAVASFDGTVRFTVKTQKQPFHNYGFGIQHIYDGKQAEIERGGGQIITVPAFSLCTLLHLRAFGAKHVDFVSLDIQSFEHAVLNATLENLRCLDSRVAVLHISLHRVEENDAREIQHTMSTLLKWQLVRYMPLWTRKHPTPFGPINMVDGRLVFVNRKLAPSFTTVELNNPLMIHKGTYTQHPNKKLSRQPDWKGPNDYII